MNLLFFLLDPLEAHILIKFSLAIPFLVPRMHIALYCNYLFLSHCPSLICTFSLARVWSLDPCTPSATEEVDVVLAECMSKSVKTHFGFRQSSLFLM